MPSSSTTTESTDDQAHQNDDDESIKNTLPSTAVNRLHQIDEEYKNLGAKASRHITDDVVTRIVRTPPWTSWVRARS